VRKPIRINAKIMMCKHFSWNQRRQIWNNITRIYAMKIEALSYFALGTDYTDFQGHLNGLQITTQLASNPQPYL